MKRYIKGKDMRDVCAEVLSCTIDPIRPQFYNIDVQWINLLGTFDHPKPFPIYSSQGPVVETLTLRIDEFSKSFGEYNTVEEVPGAKFGSVKVSS